MNELQFQTLIVDAVRSVGGFSHKMANRFLVGVPDLLAKLPKLTATFWEVKIANAPVRNTRVKLDATAPQLKWLRDYYDAGGTCGIIGGLRCSDGLYICADRIDKFEGDDLYFDVARYIKLPRGEREVVIVNEITRAVYAR